MRNGSSVSVWFQCSEEAQAIINAEDVIDIGIEIASTCKLTTQVEWSTLIKHLERSRQRPLYALYSLCDASN